MLYMTEMTKEDFLGLPKIDWKHAEGKEGFNSIVLIPDGTIHDSGFRCIKFALCNGDNPIGIISTGSDVLHLDGIGGYGKFTGLLPDKIPVKAWSIDCLPCGYFRIFSKGKLSLGNMLSDSEVFAE